MARRPSFPSQPTVLTPDQNRSAISRLERRMAELETLDPNSLLDGGDSAVVAMKAAIGQTLSDIFGSNSADWQIYKSAIDLDPGAVGRGYEAMGSKLNGGGAFRPGAPEYKAKLVESVTTGKERARSLLGQAIVGLRERMQEPTASPLSESRQSGKKVFVVHGRDDSTKNEVALFLTTIGLEPIVLHLRPSKGRHLLTKFQDESEGARFAVILMTPDDEGGIAGTGTTHKRARQNVIFELGFFIGKLGAANVAALMKGDIEKPSDLDGVLYIAIDAGGGWKSLLARELHAAELPFDATKFFSA